MIDLSDRGDLGTLTQLVAALRQALAGGLVCSLVCQICDYGWSHQVAL